ncbi:MAG: glycosyltransferase [Desulfobacteraceae bacterium]
MRIVQISTYDIRGGASRATYRLHRGLRDRGEDCRMVVRHRESEDEFVFPVQADPSGQQDGRDFFLSQVIQGHYIDAHRTEMSNTLFSLPYSGLDLSPLSLVQEADIINLHWVARFQSSISLNRLFALKKPVVWTLHDQWAFTGGCHYSAGCKGYRTDCRACPQLADDPFNLPTAVLDDKEVLFKDADLTIVTPSRWMAECAKKSRLFGDLRVEVIPNSLETDLYIPVPKPEAKEKLGLETKGVTLLFGGEDGNEKRKGFRELMGGIRYCLTDAGFQDLVGAGNLRLICFGRPNDEIASLGIPVDALGYLDSEERIRDVYAAADIFVLPSLEDNLPNTILEAMSCGTPVVAFETGGIPEMVKDGVTGRLVPLGDSESLGQALLALIFNPEERQTMGKACRKRIERDYPLEVQARSYAQLYEALIRKKGSSRSALAGVTEQGSWEAPSGFDGKKSLSAPMETALGPHFSDIYDPVLFRALKGFAPYIYKQWELSEADRRDRFDQVRQLADLLKESEADRNARLDQINKLNKLFGESEADRRATLDQISELAKMLDQEEADWKMEVARLMQSPDAIEEKELRQLSRSRLVEALRTGVHRMRDEVDRAYVRAGVAERGWKSLEATKVVRHARKLGLIRVAPYRSANNGKSQTSGNKRSPFIAVDMTPVLPGGENGGAKIFTLELLRSFQRSFRECRFLLLTASWNHEELAVLDGPNMNRLRVLTGKTKTHKSPPTRYPGLLRRGLSRINRTVRQVSQSGVTPRRLLGSRSVDLLFCPFTAPTYAESGIPTVCVLYDLQHLEFPQFFSPHEIGVRNAFMKEVRQKADHIVCISEHVRETVLKYLKTDPQKTHIAYVCIQSRLSTPDQKTLDRERFKLNIHRRPYMFYPANFWPHKNHRMLLAAYGMFLSRNPESALDLVFTGALDDLETEMKRVVVRMGLKDRVHFLGFLPQAQLEVVWQGCEFLIFPSLYEGFGIPVLEAMSMGKPVLCSNATSLPEVAGDAALYFDPRKPGHMVNCMERVTGDSRLQERLIRSGLSRAAGFSYQRMQQKYMGIFDAALKGPPAPGGEVSGIYEDGWVGEELRIHFGGGPPDRVLEIRAGAPPWLPSTAVKLKLKAGGRIVKRATVRRGREIAIRRSLPEGPGHFTLTVAPTFRPSECGIGDDDRVLGVKCEKCRIVHPDLSRITLVEGGEKCVPPSA